MFMHQDNQRGGFRPEHHVNQNFEWAVNHITFLRFDWLITSGIFPFVIPARLKRCLSWKNEMWRKVRIYVIFAAGTLSVKATDC